MSTYKNVFLNVARVDYKIEDQKMEKKHRIFIIQIIIMIKYYLKLNLEKNIQKNIKFLKISKFASIIYFYLQQ